MLVEVNKRELSETRTVEEAAAVLGAGQARIHVEAFALTANNITYAVFGDAMRYWDFFPGDEPSIWGRIPVWGFGTVVESNVAGCDIGERLYGYYPMGAELVIEPGRCDEQGVTDLSAHRAPMAGAYNRYVRCEPDPIYRQDREAQQMLLYPLFFTSFLIDDFSADQRDFDAQQIIVSSASSKTAIGVAFLAHQRGHQVVGLTSERHREFVERLGIYDTVVGYDAIDQIPRGSSTYVDIAGNRDVRHAVHAHCADDLAYSMAVGGTHWDHQNESGSAELAPPAPQFFFAPDQIKKRNDEWGRGELERRVTAAWDEYSQWTEGWLEIRRSEGAAAITDVYREVLGGTPDPRVGFICSLSQSSGS